MIISINLAEAKFLLRLEEDAAGRVPPDQAFGELAKLQRLGLIRYAGEGAWRPTEKGLQLAKDVMFLEHGLKGEEGRDG